MSATSFIRCREMVVVLQGLVILFSGALEHMFRPRIERAFQKR